MFNMAITIGIYNRHSTIINFVRTGIPDVCSLSVIIQTIVIIVLLNNLCSIIPGIYSK